MTAYLRLFLVVGWLLLLIAVLFIPALGLALAQSAAPPLPQREPQEMRLVEPGRLRVGQAQRQAVGKLLWVDAAGPPHEIGAAQGLLLQDYHADLEGDLVDALVDLVPTFIGRHLLLGLVGWNNRRLAEYFSLSERQEIAALSTAISAESDPWRSLGDPYQRALSYHALHDISQYLIDSPLVRPIRVGCSAFAVGGEHSHNGNLLVGRLFDFEGGPRFDTDKVVFTLRPDQGYAFMHVAWAGMTGAVSGLNEAGLWVSINAAASTGQRWVGRPVVMAVREILQHCATIEEAEAVLEQSQLFVSNAVLLVSRQQRRMAVIEVGPEGMARRESEDLRLISGNHFAHADWQDDPANQQRMREGSSLKRSARLSQLLDAMPVDPQRALHILRDRRGLDGKDIGFHNRSSINAWIAAHLVIADIDRGILWVSEPRHGLGAMRAFTLQGPLPSEDLPADSELQRCQEELPRWQDLLARLSAGIRDPHIRAQALEELLRLNPQHYESQWIAGLLAEDAETRRRHLQQALQLQPAYRVDRVAITQALQAEQ